MQFEWDEAKRQANLRKHGVDFADAVGVLYDDHAITRPDPDSTGEARSITIGLGSSLRILLVVWTERRGEIYRLISARRASPGEIRQYQE
ncbi:MAG: BrnT family toxin [Xanthomonadales bacterium]|nr:BrnT family toxin [Xanthomonadales bacterium]MBK7144154.1 BrnT family toxin [Xanthomonadales bacterium]MCC6561078.1 BrnT family toxin [Xanthomonadales bacterium]